MLYARDAEFRIVAVDPTEMRRKKVESIYAKVSQAYGKQRNGHLEVSDIAASKDIVTTWTEGIGCNFVLEVRVISSVLTFFMVDICDTGRWKHECTVTRV